MSTENLAPDWYNGVIKNREDLQEALEMEKILLKHYQEEQRLVQGFQAKCGLHLDIINTEAHIASLEEELENWDGSNGSTE